MDAKQVVLITGASTGFGRLFTETLARSGRRVFATMRGVEGKNAKNAAEIRELAKQESLAIEVLELDVTKESSVDAAVAAVVQRAGRVDVAISNAGYGLLGLTEAVTVEQSQQVMDTNFFGAVRVNRAVLPHMRKQKSGLLMHISSGAGRLAIPSFSFYCASKFAMEAMAEAYHYELAGQGIESVIVEPGAYKTPVFGNMVIGSDLARTETYGAANRIGEKMNALLTGSAADPQEVADAVLKILETPVGQKKLRYRVSPSDIGVDEINAVAATVQARMLVAFGLSEETRFAKKGAVGAD